MKGEVGMIQFRRNAGDEPKMGIFFELDSPLAMECTALAGFDYAIVDLEHGPLSTQGAVELICRGKLHGMAVLVRPQDFTRASILKALDAGADGLVVPGIRTVEDAKSVVRHGKYRPIGDRGVALARAAAYGCDPEINGLPDLFRVKNRDTQLLLQCETAECLENIEEIAALEGVDGIFIGPYDLSTELGIAGQFGDERMILALERVVKACRAAGKPVLIFSPTPRDAALRKAQGYDGIAVSTASSVLISGMRQLLAQSLEQAD